ncbi:hypothetical protein E4T56_gene1705 [Termitomyces sp. T112]|nr:hypothetical protein E4T56_gene1705 [Termitomyces sp. T112]KNZ79982.1 hypothetical protein J132_08298 [Termitomyces sp. J132]
MARNTRFFGGVFGGAAAGAVVVPELVVGALNCIGFTALGPAAGSIAAGIQSSIGCVAAGSPFAIAQSIAMGGMAGPLVATGAVVGVTAVLVSTALRSSQINDNEPNPDSDEDGDGPDGEEERK